MEIISEYRLPEIEELTEEQIKILDIERSLIGILWVGGWETGENLLFILILGKPLF